MFTVLLTRIYNQTPIHVIITLWEIILHLRMIRNRKLILRLSCNPTITEMNDLEALKAHLMVILVRCKCIADRYTSYFK